MKVERERERPVVATRREGWGRERRERERERDIDVLDVNKAEIVESADIRCDLRADSLDSAMIFVHLEEKFGINLPEFGTKEYPASIYHPYFKVGELYGFCLQKLGCS